MKDPLKILFAEAAEKWLDYVTPGIKYSSLARYTNVLKKYLLPEFSDIPVSEITREQVDRFLAGLLQNGSADLSVLAPTSVVIVFSVLRNIMSFSGGKLGCPVADLGSVSIRRQSKKLRVFSMSEQSQLNEYLSQNPTRPNAGILLTLYTGLRIGEICALKWQDVSLKDWSLYIHQTMQRVQTFQEKPRTHVTITAPKSICSIRHIPIPDFLHEMLLSIYNKPDSFFLTGKPDKYIEPRSLENQFKRVLQACDIKDATFHTLRHTFATRCIEQGFDVKTLSEILGHATVNITMNRYVHPSMEFKRENMNKLSNLIDGEIFFAEYNILRKV